MLKNMKNSKYSRKYLKVKTKQKKWAFAFKRKYHFNEIQFKTKNGHLQLNENIISMKYNVRYKENKRMIQINKIKKKGKRNLHYHNNADSHHRHLPHGSMTHNCMLHYHGCGSSVLVSCFESACLCLFHQRHYPFQSEFG